jgi:formylglycine-generating enzyme required for sulfatase activity
VPRLPYFNAALAIAVLLSTGVAQADQFGEGANSFQIEFVPIGNPGNPADANPNPAGAVAYPYRIGKYEVSEQMIDKANVLGGLGITKDVRGPDFPVTNVSWYEAAKFVNWLNTSTGHTPAYKFDANGVFQLWLPADTGYNSTNLYRNRQAKYFLPSLNEWHKAAYYDPVAATYYDYPTGSDSVPDGIDFVGDTSFDAVFFDGGSNGGPNAITDVGLLSPYGTAAQGGNVNEWQETAVDRVNDSTTEGRLLHGGGWNWSSSVMLASNTNGIIPSFEGSVGFRVTRVIPEPSTAALVGTALLALVGMVKRVASRSPSH